MIEINYRREKKPLPVRGAVVEIGFGNGDFLIRHAMENPDRPHIGFEISGISIAKVVRKARRMGLKNLRVAKIDAYWGFYLLLPDESVERAYMNFPDPWPKKRHASRRLTNLENLYIFHSRIKTGGSLILKTDERFFVDYTLENAEEMGGWEWKVEENALSEIPTKYERKWIEEGKTIYRLTLEKVGPPSKKIEIRHIKEVEEVPHMRTEKPRFHPEELSGKVFRLPNGTVAKFFNMWRGNGEYLLETLLVENGYEHYFMTRFRKKDNDWVIGVSPFSEVLKTEGIRDLILWLSGRDL